VKDLPKKSSIFRATRIAVAGFRKELAYNEEQVKEVRTRMPELRAKIERAISRLSAAPIPREAGLDYPGFSLDIVSTAGWDTASALKSCDAALTAPK
jgi:hypothetical protein